MSPSLAGWLGVLSLGLVPLLLMVSTSFVKASVVLTLLRNALGTGSVPPASVVFALSALLAAYVMAPVAEQMKEVSAPVASGIDLDAPFEGESRDALLEALSLAAGPLRDFLERNAGERERALFVDMKRGARPAARRDTVDAGALLVVLPAFLITELREALHMGFLLLLPFLVVDLAVASVLGALGMLSLSPATVSLPLKLLLFLSVDGFYLLSEALLKTYV